MIISSPHFPWAALAALCLLAFISIALLKDDDCHG
jgi:hypothetical protein